MLLSGNKQIGNGELRKHLFNNFEETIFYKLIKTNVIIV